MPNAWERLRDRYALLAEAAILALIDNTGKEVMPLDAGTTETQTQAHDIGPGDQAVAGAAPVMSNQTYESLRVSGDAILHGMGLMKDGKHVPAREFYAQPEPVADAAQCWMCGKRGPQCELSDGRWVCSSDCYDVALGIMLKPVAGAAPVTVQEAARVLLKWEAQQGAVHDACSGVVKVYRFNRVLESLAALAQKGGAAPWPENLFGLTGDTLHLRCATEGCGQRVSTRFEADGISSDYCEPCGRKVAGAALDCECGMGFGPCMNPQCKAPILAQKGGAAPWPEGLIHLTNTRRFHVDCATEGCGQRVRTRFAGSDYCEPCGRKVALAQKRDSHE
jgi:hypothetical protein